MEPEQTPIETEQEDKFANLKKVTQLSKFLTLAFFIILPLVGFWLGVEYGTSYSNLAESNSLDPQTAGVAHALTQPLPTERILIIKESEIKCGYYEGYDNSTPPNGWTQPMESYRVRLETLNGACELEMQSKWKYPDLTECCSTLGLEQIDVKTVPRSSSTVYKEGHCGLIQTAYPSDYDNCSRVSGTDHLFSCENPDCEQMAPYECQVQSIDKKSLLINDLMQTCSLAPRVYLMSSERGGMIQDEEQCKITDVGYEKYAGRRVKTITTQFGICDEYTNSADCCNQLGLTYVGEVERQISDTISENEKTGGWLTQKSLLILVFVVTLGAFIVQMLVGTRKKKGVDSHSASDS